MGRGREGRILSDVAHQHAQTMHVLHFSLNRNGICVYLRAVAEGQDAAQEEHFHMFLILFIVFRYKIL